MATAAAPQPMKPSVGTGWPRRNSSQNATFESKGFGPETLTLIRTVNL